MPSLFHWSPAKKLAGIRVQRQPKKLELTTSEVVADPALSKKVTSLPVTTNPILLAYNSASATNDQSSTTPIRTSSISPTKRQATDELPFIDRSSSPSTVNFSLKREPINNDADLIQQKRQYSPQKNYANEANYGNEHYYFPQHEARMTSGGPGLERVQRSVHFDEKKGMDFDEENWKFSRSGSTQNQQRQNVPVSAQSVSTPATPLTANRESFGIATNTPNNYRSQNFNNSISQQHHSNVPLNYTPPTHHLDPQSVTNYANQDSHNYPPPPYSSTTQASNPIRFSAPANSNQIIDPMPQSKTSAGYHQQPSPKSLPQERNLNLRNNDDAYFGEPALIDVVPPRPPRQQQTLFQRSNSTGSSTTAGSTRTQHLLHQLNHRHYPKENRANLILQQLRADDGAQSESDVSTNEPIYSYNHTSRPLFGRSDVIAATNMQQSMMYSKGVVYLEFNKEVKRSNLPTRLYTFEQIKSLFLRSFPNLTLQFLNQEHVKIYIADRHSSISGSENVLFYELEDLNDVKDQTVLKIHQSQVYRSPPPSLRFTDQPPTDYISEPEVDERTKRYESYRTRPASAVPETSRIQYAALSNTVAALNGGGNNRLHVTKQDPHSSSQHFQVYYDPYFSDASSQGPRSGSATPIIDKETRQRVETMERQLAGLSTLVRSALIHQNDSSGNKNANSDMMDLGRRLLEIQSNAAERFGFSATTNSATSSTSAIDNKQLVQMRRSVRDMQINLNELRDFIEIDKQTRSSILHDIFAKIVSRLEECARLKRSAESERDKNLEKMKQQYQTTLEQLDKLTQVLENKIESRRRDVLSKNYKLRMFEVDELTGELHSIDRKNNCLREQYLELEDEACKLIDYHKNSIDTQAEFLRREPAGMDQLARRCTALSNMLATMKKLALVQDPSFYDGNKPQINDQTNGVIEKIPPKVAPKPSAVQTNGILNETNGNKNEQLPPLPHPLQRVSSPNPIRSVTATATHTTLSSANANVLDSILDELNHTANTLPKILEDQTPNGVTPMKNGKIRAKVSDRQVVEASASLTLKESQANLKSKNAVEKYDNIKDDQTQQQSSPFLSQAAKLQRSTCVAFTDPRRFVTAEAIKFRPANTNHVTLSASEHINGRY